MKLFIKCSASSALKYNYLIGNAKLQKKNELIKFLEKNTKIKQIIF